MTILAYATGPNGDDEPQFAVIVDGEGFEYVWPPSAKAEFTPEERLAAHGDPDTAGWDEEAYADLATHNLGTAFTDWVEVKGDRKAAKQLAAEELADPSAPSLGHELRSSEAWDDMPQSFYEGDFEAGDEDGPSADDMLLLVSQALGDIDPNGPNGHILRALDGTPFPGDEDMYVTFGAPAAPLPDEEDE